MGKKIFIGGLLGFVFVALSLFVVWSERGRTIFAERGAQKGAAAPTQTSDTGEREEDISSRHVIDGLTHAWQTFNNCSSVALMAALSHWDVRDSQEAIAEATRPWNNARGDNDDKSVTLYELADYAEAKYALLTYVRPDGDIELLKEFVANDIPVVTRTLMYPKDDIVHYRVIRGYDDEAGVLIESDGINGPNFSLPYGEWLHLWKNFNYSYLIARLRVLPRSAFVGFLAEDLLDQSFLVAWHDDEVRVVEILPEV